MYDSADQEENIAGSYLVAGRLVQLDWHRVSSGTGEEGDADKGSVLGSVRSLKDAYSSLWQLGQRDQCVEKLTPRHSLLSARSAIAHKRNPNAFRLAAAQCRGC